MVELGWWQLLGQVSEREAAIDNVAPYGGERRKYRDLYLDRDHVVHAHVQNLLP